jgi:hypothetical protein
MKITNLLILFSVATLSLMGESRTWTSKDGRKIEAEYVSTTKEKVTVRRADGLTVAIPLAVLSDDDVAWVDRQPKPVEVSLDQLNKIIAEFPRAPALSNGEVTNDLKQLHDKYESMVKFIRPGTIGPNVKMIRKKMDDDIKIFGEIAKTSSGDHSGKRGSTQSKGAENTILSARSSLKWLEGALTSYMNQFDPLMGDAK